MLWNLRSTTGASMRQDFDARPTAPKRSDAAERIRPGRARAAKDFEPLELGVLRRHLGYFVRRLQVWVFKDFIRTLASLDLRPAQYSVLLLIEGNPGRSQAAIGRSLNIERARLTRLLHQLERRRWIERRRATANARSHALFLTREGKKMMPRIKQLAAQHEARLIEFVGSARHKRLLRLLSNFG